MLSCRTLVLVLSLPLGLQAKGVAWMPPVTLTDSGAKASEPAVALNGKGQGLAVWSQNDQGQYRIFGAAWLNGEDPRGGQWGPACRIQTGDGSQGLSTPSKPRVVLNASGLGLAVWSDKKGAWASFWQKGAWGEPARISTGRCQPDPDGLRPEAGLDGAGNATVAWASDGVAVARFAPASGWKAPVEDQMGFDGCLALSVHPTGHVGVLGGTLTQDDQMFGYETYYKGLSAYPSPIWGGISHLSSFDGETWGIGFLGATMVQGIDRYYYADVSQSPVGDGPISYNLHSSAGQSWKVDGVNPGKQTLVVDGSNQAFLAWLSQGVPRVARASDQKMDSTVLGPVIQPGGDATTLRLAVAHGGQALVVCGVNKGIWTQVYRPAMGPGAGQWGAPFPGPSVPDGDELALALNDAGQALAIYLDAGSIRAALLQGPDGATIIPGAMPPLRWAD